MNPAKRTSLPKEREEGKPTDVTVIRSELNVERWPLFTTSKYPSQSREFVRQQVERGKVVTKKVVIGKLGDKEVGVFRILDLKVFYALIKLWETAGNPFEKSVNFAIHEIAKIIGKAWSGRTYQEIKESLLRLRGIPITWINSFYQKDTDTVEEYLELFNILSELKIYTRRQGGAPPIAASSFKFNDRLVRNLLSHYSKPLYLDVVMGLKKEISILLYLHLDLVMADKLVYSRMSGDLIRDLGLSGDYRFPSYRKRVLSPALEELEGLPLSTGILVQATIEPCEGDWQVIFKKALPSSTKPEWEIKALVEDILQVTGDEQSRGFYTKVAMLCPDDLIYRCLSEVKDEWLQGRVKKSKGALFTDKIKRYCQERGIDLKLRASGNT